MLNSPIFSFWAFLYIAWALAAPYKSYGLFSVRGKLTLLSVAKFNQEINHEGGLRSQQTPLLAKCSSMGSFYRNTGHGHDRESMRFCALIL